MKSCVKAVDFNWLVVSLWRCCFRRNSSVHDKSEVSVVDISCWPAACLEKFRAARVGGEMQSPQPSLGRWLPPAYGLFKVNSDASIRVHDRGRPLSPGH
ncbi:hypothetical protein ACOSQ3_009511 [Xanthoceras sorbifolium]